jgi:uncharacterized protein YcbK (DUF882 family)
MRIENGYYIWNKDQNTQLTTHFNTSEFACTCKRPECITQKISVVLVEKLQAVRWILASPITVVSGFRCKGKMEDLRKEGAETVPEGSTSQHELGNAADPFCEGQYRQRMRDLLDACFDSMGIGASKTHVDTRPGKRRWTYKS